jgi:hypothetical protein
MPFVPQEQKSCNSEKHYFWNFIPTSNYQGPSEGKAPCQKGKEVRQYLPSGSLKSRVERQAGKELFVRGGSGDGIMINPSALWKEGKRGEGELFLVVIFVSDQ